MQPPRAGAKPDDRVPLARNPVVVVEGGAVTRHGVVEDVGWGGDGGDVDGGGEGAGGEPRVEGGAEAVGGGGGEGGEGGGALLGEDFGDGAGGFGGGLEGGHFGVGGGFVVACMWIV